MTGEDSEWKSVESIANATTERMQDLPASTSAEATDDGSPASARYRLFNRQRSIHQVLGGGKAADSMLWRSKRLSGVTLAGATIAWLLFENSGYSVLSIASDVLIVLIVGLFACSNAAVLVHKSPPRIPELQLSEDMVFAVLWGLSVVGGWFHFLTFVYICVLLSHAIPAVYERYEDQIDSYVKGAMDEAQTRYRSVSAAVASQFSKVASKEKKGQ